MNFDKLYQLLSENASIAEIAQSKGYNPQVVYHGSIKDFTKFRERQNGIWFAFDKKDASPGSGENSNTVKSFFLKYERPHRLTEEQMHRFQHAESVVSFMRWLRMDTWDSKPDAYIFSTYSICVFKNTQIKLADETTYDNKGQPIDISQRFDSSKADVRY